MLSIQNSDELKNLIVFHRHEIPTYIREYGDMDTYQKMRLDKLLLRMNVNHKTLFFADKPIFVEGYIDQQFFNILQYKREIPLGAEGISIIDVGGKDEIDIMYSLCRLLKIDAFCIIDMDGLFEGKLRQTVDKISEVGTFMAKKGKDSLMKSIGSVEKLLNEEIDEVLKYKDELSQGELKEFLDVLRAQSGEKANMMRKRIMFLGLHRIRSEILAILSAEGERKVLQIEGVAKDIFECFNILRGLTKDSERVYSFDEKTVAANFKV